MTSKLIITLIAASALLGGCATAEHRHGAMHEKMHADMSPEMKRKMQQRMTEKHSGAAKAPTQVPAEEAEHKH
jgi:hypothetical protein